MFTLRMLFLCVILHNMWSGKRLQLLCILYVGGYGGLSERSGLCVFRELCPVSFLVIGESPFFLVVCSHVVC